MRWKGFERQGPKSELRSLGKVFMERRHWPGAVSFQTRWWDPRDFPTNTRVSRLCPGAGGGGEAALLKKNRGHRLDLLGRVVFVYLCFRKLDFGKVFVAGKFLLQSLQMVWELISCFYAVIMYRFKVS